MVSVHKGAKEVQKREAELEMVNVQMKKQQEVEREKRARE